VPERRWPLAGGAAFLARLQRVDAVDAVPVLAIRLPELERVAWRRGVRAARLLERRAVAAFGTAVARVLRAEDLVAHERGSDVFVCALAAPMRGETGAPSDARAALARIAAAMEAALRVRAEAGWTSVEPRQALPPLETLIERALARGAQERERFGFFSALGHELRTPLAAIRGYLETVLDEAVEGEQRRRFVRIAYHETVRMSRLVEGMFEISLLDLHGGAPARAGGSLDAALDATRDAVETTASRRGTTLVFPAPTALHVALDADRLTLLLRNLVENAIAHGRPAGRVELRADASARTVRLVVEDDGPGVPPGERERIFALGERGTTHAGGSGIGLALVRLMVERAGGRVSVGEASLGGARFTLTLPRSLPAAAPMATGDGRAYAEPDGALGRGAARGAPAVRR